MAMPQFSLRTLLACTALIAVIGGFAVVRSRPLRNAERFQAAIERGDGDIALSMMDANIAQTLGAKPTDKLEFEAFKFQPQSPGQWLHGECLGQLTIKSRSSGESNDAVWSVIKIWHCDVAVTSRGVQVLRHVEEEPLVAGAPKPPFESATDRKSGD
jgi:hypothetical protein